MSISDPKTAWDIEAEKNPPRVLLKAQARGGSEPKPSFGLWEDRVIIGETRKNSAKRKAPKKKR